MTLIPDLVTLHDLGTYEIYANALILKNKLTTTAGDIKLTVPVSEEQQ